jgi:hypothetical protein
MGSLAEQDRLSLGEHGEDGDAADQIQMGKQGHVAFSLGMSVNRLLQ